MKGPLKYRCSEMLYSEPYAAWLNGGKTGLKNAQATLSVSSNRFMLRHASIIASTVVTRAASIIASTCVTRAIMQA